MYYYIIMTCLHVDDNDELNIILKLFMIQQCVIQELI